MMKNTMIALVAALAMFGTSAAMARTHTTHSHGAHVRVTNMPQEPGYARAAPTGPDWGSQCVTDDGQGRFVPCDSAE